MILVKDSLQPILCAEEQILNLCENEFLVFNHYENNWQFTVSMLFKAQKINTNRLISLAQKRFLAHQLIQMFQELSSDFDVKIPTDLLNELRKIPKVGKIFFIRQKLQELKQSYQMYSKSEKQSNLRISFHKFLLKRWKLIQTKF